MSEPANDPVQDADQPREEGADSERPAGSSGPRDEEESIALDAPEYDEA